MTRRTFLSTLALPFVAGVFDRAFAQQKAPTPPGAPEIPPVSYSCPMHAEVVDNKPGKCPICGMTMVPVRLAFVWSCSTHTEVVKHAAGKCPKCGRDLVRVTKALTFTCPAHPKVDELNPGKCPICKRTLVERYSIRPHGDHNPKHGGQFFMVSNNWHMEVTHPAAGVFRFYVYDEYSKPFQPPGFAARIVEVPGPGGKKQEVNIPFVRVKGTGYAEAKAPGLEASTTLAVKAKFEAADKEHRFDFIFLDYSKDPNAGRGR